MRKLKCGKKEKCVEVIQILGEDGKQGPPGPQGPGSGIENFIYSIASYGDRIQKVINPFEYQDVIMDIDVTQFGWSRTLANEFPVPTTGIYEITYDAILSNYYTKPGGMSTRIVFIDEFNVTNEILGSVVNTVVGVGAQNETVTEYEVVSKTVLYSLKSGYILKFQFGGEHKEMVITGDSIGKFSITTPFSVSIKRVK